ncbi:hypothetical protein K6119_10010 [Paracrocinitomix mangrovi]|uniref:hypothetical protein n=1 Tax=Paracrocinitomix mangrovi TaxID=2862509 RepID=UPI001C8EC6D3|nr:hypothetical protein [Paracrocinitomix mangrovi]UKN03825.1 hypothetical protein K6119_10010 [Paracrocinitomix mangrovi]
METFLNILIKAHSGWRWVVLILLVAALVKLFMGMRKGATYTAGDKKIGTFAMIAFHIQWTIGLVLYFFPGSKVQIVEGFMKNSMLRFYALEHIVAMTIAFILITIGHSKAKKTTEDKKKFKTQFTFYFIAFIIIMLSIPWPFRQALGGHWF